MPELSRCSIARCCVLVAFLLGSIACERQGAAGAAGAARAAGRAAGAQPGSAAAVANQPGSARALVADSSFARIIERLSEPGQYFDTDNLISNETSYLHVVSVLEEMGVSGGAYIGVGPDQNFSYIARIRPSVAFIIDIRRDNMLQQLLFKALFSLSRNRVEYLALLLGRPVPADLVDWDDRSLEQLIEYVGAAPISPHEAESLQSVVEIEVKSSGLPLTEQDLSTIRRYHRTFIANGLDLRFSSHGRAPLREYPTYRRLLLERDLTGRRASYLAREGDFQFVKSLQERDLIIPVVGDLAGPHALRAIGEYVAERGERVSAFYTSNVEFYLWGDGSFDRFARNTIGLPRSERSVIIRSYFGRRFRHPRSVPGYLSTQLLQTIDDFSSQYTAGDYRSYLDLVLGGALD